MIDPRRSAAILAEQTADGGDRFVDLEVRLCVADVDTSGAHPQWRPETDDELVRVGGRWDRSRKEWAPGAAARVAVFRVHRGQEAAARWLAEWLRRQVSGDWKGVERAWSALLIGGRRSGKSHLAMLALVLYAVAMPGAIVWAVSPTLDANEELEAVLRGLMPRRWYRRREVNTGKLTTYRFANGSKLVLLSGHKPRGLKKGRVDVALLNESQEQYHAAYVRLRAAIADRSGLVLLSANPPDAPIGRWVEEHYERAMARKIDGVVFTLDPRLNPWIDMQTLEAMKHETDEVTYKREVLGVFAPIGDVVFHAWSDRESWLDPWAGLVDITPEVTRRELGREFAYVVGMDFQQTPHMAAAVVKFFRDPGAPENVLTWVVDEAVVEHADEEDLLDALEAQEPWTFGGRVAGDCYRGWPTPGEALAHGACVIDASGFWQDGAHGKGRTSELALKARKWTHLYMPQKDSDRNPEVVERVKIANARLKTHDGVRRLFVARHCLRAAEAMRRWENRNGRPHRTSEFAHMADAVTYAVFRFFGKPAVTKVMGEYRGIKRTRFHELKKGW